MLRKPAPRPTGGFRLRMEMKDGALVRNRKLNDFVMDRPVDIGFVELVLKSEAREKGVRVIKYELVPEGINATVEWL